VYDNVPTLYFSKENRDSSISTIFLFPLSSKPPKTHGLDNRWSWITSLKSKHQLEMVFLFNSRASVYSVCKSFLQNLCVALKMVIWDVFKTSNAELYLQGFSFLHIYKHKHIRRQPWTWHLASWAHHKHMCMYCEWYQALPDIPRFPALSSIQYLISMSQNTWFLEPPLCFYIFCEIFFHFFLLIGGPL